MSVKLLKPGGEKIPLTFANKDEWIRFVKKELIRFGLLV
jgi:hypothetical protein